MLLRATGSLRWLVRSQELTAARTNAACSAIYFPAAGGARLVTSGRWPTPRQSDDRLVTAKLVAAAVAAVTPRQPPWKLVLDSLLPLIAVLIGAYAAFLGRRSVVADEVCKEAEAEFKKAGECANAVNAAVHSALHLIQVARSDYLRRSDSAPTQIRLLLENAEASVLQAEQRLGTGAHREKIQARLATDFNIAPAMLSNLHALIAYHRAAVDPRGEADEAAVLRAGEQLARALVSTAEPERQVKPSAAALELAGSSRSGDAACACSAAGIFETVWKIRAANSAAAEEFGRGNDTGALTAMQAVARITGEWLHNAARMTGLEVETGALAALQPEAVALGARSPTGPLSDAVLRLVNMGADDAVTVGILHSESAPSAAAAAARAAAGEGRGRRMTLPVRSADTADTAVREVAAGYLERVTLMLREYRTSRAECLLIACAPGSTALDCRKAHSEPEDVQQQPCLDGELLFALLEDAVEEPWTPAGAGSTAAAGLALHAALDREWLAQEGSTQLLAAVGLALVQLVAAGAVPSSTRADVLRVADELTRMASELAKLRRPRRDEHGQPRRPHPGPDVLACIAAVAHARVLHVREVASLAEDGHVHALQELSAPASRMHPSSCVVAWSAEQQLRAKRLADEAATSTLKTPMRVPPRAARWQATVLAYAQDLRRQRDSAPCASGWSAQSLSFAVRNYPASHPLRQLAEAGFEFAPPVRKSAFVADEARMHALLARVRKWTALCC